MPVCVAALLLAGCDKSAPPAAKPEAAAPSAPSDKKATAANDEKAAIEAAKQAVAANDASWSDRAIYEAKRDKDTGGWWVTVWRIAGRDKDGKPLFTPGGHRGVRVDKTGKVTGYMRGE